MRFLFRSCALWTMCFVLPLTTRALAEGDDPQEDSALKASNTAPAQTSDAPPSPPQQVLKAGNPAPAFPRPGVRSTAIARPVIEPRVTTQTRQALNFYGGYAARATLSRQPRRTPVQSSPPPPMYRQVKPFQTIYRDPTVSPYLNLHRDEASNEGAPNYFSFVRPQMEQIEANRRAQRDIQQLNGQLQGLSGSALRPQYQVHELPGTGTPARYMDTAQFYGGLRR
jgi:hypothetical protein